jgi:hypothetical protein
LNVKDVSSFQKFIKLCAGRIGQLFNANSLANEIGVSHQTIQAWLSAMQATYIVFLVQPWSVNTNKRLVKTPKLYFYDVGLASYLLGIENTIHVSTHPLRGSLFENMIALEFLKKRYNAGLDNNLYFLEIIMEMKWIYFKKQVFFVNLIEIKSAQTFHSDFLKGLEYFKKILSNRVGSSNLVYAGESEMIIKGHKISNFKNL